MKKYNENFYRNESNNTLSNDNEKEGHLNKIKQNSIINKIHSIQASLNENNKSKYAKRKNNFRRGGNEYRTQENIQKSRAKSKNWTQFQSKSQLKSKKGKESLDLRQSKNNTMYNKVNHMHDYNNSMIDQSICNNNTNNNFFTNNNSNNGLNTNNNIIITINNYNKITPTNIAESSNTIPKQKSKENTSIDNKQKDSKKLKYSNNDNNKNLTKKQPNKNKREIDKKAHNYYYSSNANLDNWQNNPYNNNIHLKHIMPGKNGSNFNNNLNSEYNDDVSVNTYNTINDSSNVPSKNNTTNRENSNRAIIKKNNNYQDNIQFKKKQLGMYSPLSILKRNFNIPSKTENQNIYNKQIKDPVKSFNITESSQYEENNIDKNNRNDDIDNNLNINIEISKNGHDENRKNYNFNRYNINQNNNNNNKNYNIQSMQNENNKNMVNNNTSNNLGNQNNNKNQVKNILSKIKQIKNTKQIYNNKKTFGFSKIHRRKEKERAPLYSIYNPSFLKSRPSYTRLTDRNINNNQYFYYSRSNSKNVLSERNRNLNLKFFNFSQKRASKSNQKLLDRSFISESGRIDKKKSTNKLLLSYQTKRNKMYIFKNINNSTNNGIKTENFYNENEPKKKFIGDINDNCFTLNSINSNNNDNNNNNMKTILNKNNTSNTVSTNIDSSSNRNKLIDTYENSTITNINKHCDSLLSKINKKMKEKEPQNNNYNNNLNIIKAKEEIEKIKITINNIEESKNKITHKKIISNASLSRRGLNRPDEMMKINQDTLFKVKFGDINYSYYGVCDGHGPSGHFVSDFIKSHIAFIVYKHLKSLLIQNKNNSTTTLNKVDDSNIDFTKLFKDCFLLMDSKLRENKSIDIELSGTTCVSLLFCENRIISANVGDSRAIKGQYNSMENKWNYIPLSRDHKPSDKDEAERIKKYNGLIHPYIDDDGNYAGPDRVWMDDELPGLAMSRSFGDEIASRVGVFSEPEVKVFPFKEEDRFIVIASDGLWEYVTNEEVIDIVKDYFEKKDCDGAVSKLYEISHERWVQYDDYIDDISIIVVFIN